MEGKFGYSTYEGYYVDCVEGRKIISFSSKISPLMLGTGTKVRGYITETNSFCIEEIL